MLRTLDLRALRPSSEIYFGEGAMALKWYFGAGNPQVLAASASGRLQLLDARGGMTAPSDVQLSMAERGEQLCSLDVSARPSIWGAPWLEL